MNSVNEILNLVCKIINFIEVLNDNHIITIKSILIMIFFGIDSNIYLYINYKL